LVDRIQNSEFRSQHQKRRGNGADSDFVNLGCLPILTEQADSMLPRWPTRRPALPLLLSPEF
jgi:hypothetical protein